MKLPVTRYSPTVNSLGLTVEIKSYNETSHSGCCEVLLDKTSLMIYFSVQMWNGLSREAMSIL